MPASVNIPIQTSAERHRAQRRRQFSNATIGGVAPATSTATSNHEQQTGRQSYRSSPASSPQPSPLFEPQRIGAVRKQSQLPRSGECSTVSVAPSVHEDRESNRESPQVLTVHGDSRETIDDSVSQQEFSEYSQQYSHHSVKRESDVSTQMSTLLNYQGTQKMSTVIPMPAPFPEERISQQQPQQPRSQAPPQVLATPPRQRLPVVNPPPPPPRLEMGPPKRQPSSGSTGSNLKKPKIGSKSYRRSLIYTVLGITGFAAFDPVVDYSLRSTLMLKEDGLVANQWKSLPIPINACFYLFELKNSKEFLNGGKPHLNEVGPFCYDEYKPKFDIEWKEDRVKYKEKFRFEFRPDDSASPDQVLEVINYPLMTVIQMAKYLLKAFYLSFTSPLVMNLVTLLLKATGENLIEQRTAREILEGRKLKLVEFIDVIANPIRDMGIPIPGFGVGFYALNNASFGFVALRQITEFGPYEVYTETKDGHSIGEYYEFNNHKTIQGYKSPCNRIAGSDGTFFGDNFKGKQLDIFNQHICRTVRLVHNGTSYRAGTPLRRFTMSHDAYSANAPENQCYCPTGQTKQQCNGMSDMAPCFGGVQLYLSYPHFLYAPERQAQFEGLKPDPVKHQAEVVLDDRIGAPIYVSLGIQANLHVEPFSYVPELRKIRQVPFPMFWANEGLALPKPLEIAAGIGLGTLQYGSWLMLASGVGAGGLSAYRTRRRNRQVQ